MNKEHVCPFSAVLRWSDWQKKQVRTLIVNPRAKDAIQRSINSALTFCSPYDRVELLSGEYHESVTLAFPVEIVASEGEDPKVTFRGAAILCSSDTEGYIKNVSFHSKSQSKGDAAVIIAAGRPLFLNCVMCSILVTGVGKPSFVRCEVTMSLCGVGVQVSECGGGLFDECRVHSHEEICIDVDTAGEALFRRNVVSQKLNNTMAIRCTGIGSGGQHCGRELCGCVTFELNQIFCDKLTADAEIVATKGRGVASLTGEVSCVYVTQNAKPFFVANEILEGEVGFIFDTGGQPRLKANIIRAQRRCGILVILGKESVIAEGIKIQDGNLFERCRIGIEIACLQDKRWWKPEGWSEIEFCEKVSSFVDQSSTSLGKPSSEELASFLSIDIAPGGVDILSTRFLYCSEYGVKFCSRSFGVVANCTFEKCGIGGVLAEDGSRPRIELSKFLRNGEHAIKACGDTHAFVSRNEVFQQPNNGVVLDRVAQCVLYNNTITQCGGYGVLVQNSSCPLVIANVFDGNEKGAIACASGSKGTFVNNGIFRSRASQVTVTENAQPIFFGNEIFGGAVEGISLLKCGNGCFARNTISCNTTHGVTVSLGADPLFEDNVISKNVMHGVFVFNNGLGTFTENNVEDNEGHNVLVSEGGDPTVRANRIHMGHLSGICISEEGCGRFEKNLISGNLTTNILVRDSYSNPIIVANDVQRSVGSGLLCEKKCEGNISKNTFHDNTRCGIVLMTGANPTLCSNNIHREAVGALICEDGLGVFQNNSFHHCTSGMLVELDGTPLRVTRNKFAFNSHAGLVLSPSSGGSFQENEFRQNGVCGIRSCAAHETHNKFERSPQIQQNIVAENELCGVLLESDACGTFVDNDIFGNGRFGILADVEGGTSDKRESDSCRIVSHIGGGTAHFIRNRIRDHAVNVYFRNHPFDNQFLFEKNIIQAAKSVGVLLERGSVIAEFTENVVLHCLEGILFDEGSRGSFKKNILKLCDRCGVHIRRASNPLLRENAISGHGDFGILIDHGGGGTLVGNSIFENRIAGIVVFPGACHAVVEKNEIFSNDLIGVYVPYDITSNTSTACTRPRFPHFGSNCIRKNGLCGVYCETHVSFFPPTEIPCETTFASVHLDASVVSSPSRHRNPLEMEGTIASPSATPRHKYRELSPNSSPSKRKIASTATELRLEEESISLEYAQDVVERRLSSMVVFNENLITQNIVGIVVSSHCDPFFLMNRIISNDIGVVTQPSGCPQMMHNEICENNSVGLFCFQFSRGFFLRNHIHDNNGHDCTLCALVSRDAHAQSGSKLADHNDVLWRRCNSFESVRANLISHAMEGGVFAGGTGVWLEVGSEAEFAKNNISRHSRVGISMCEPGMLRAVFAATDGSPKKRGTPRVIRKISSSLGGTPIIRNNNVHDNTDGIVVSMVHRGVPTPRPTVIAPRNVKSISVHSIVSSSANELESIGRSMISSGTHVRAAFVCLRIEGNEIHHNRQRGISVEAHEVPLGNVVSKVQLKENEFSMNGVAAVEAESQLVDKSEAAEVGHTTTTNNIHLAATGNKFSQCNCGLWIHSGYRDAVVSHNNFTTNDGEAIRIEGAVSSAIVGPSNTFTRNAVGVLIRDSPQRSEPQRQTIIANNVFLGNLGFGVLLKNEATALVIHNIFKGHERRAVGLAFVGDLCTAFASQNEFTENCNALAVAHGAHTIRVESNSVQNNEQGICIFDEGGGFFATNWISSNTVCGVHVVGKTVAPVFYRNVFENHPTSPQDHTALIPTALFIDGASRGHYCCNAFYDNATGCIMNSCESTSSMLLFWSNVLRDSSEHAILIDAQYTLPDILSGEDSPSTQFFGARQGRKDKPLPAPFTAGSSCLKSAPVLPGIASSCSIVSNLFEQNTLDVTFRRRGSAFVSKNVFLGETRSEMDGRGVCVMNFFLGAESKSHRDCGIRICESGSTKFHENFIRGYSIGAVCSALSGGEMCRNILCQCGIGIDAARSSATVCAANVIADMTDCGVRAVGASFEKNEVVRCPVGIVIPPEADPSSVGVSIFTENSVCDCGDVGVLVAGGATLQSNTIHSCPTNVTVLSAAALPTIEKNIIMDAANVGLLIAPQSRALIKGNDIFDNSKCSVEIEPDSRCVLEGNRISHPSERSALNVAPDSKCQLKDNTVRNQYSPVYMKGHAAQRAKLKQKTRQLVTDRISACDTASSEALRSMHAIVEAAQDLRASVAEKLSGSSWSVNDAATSGDEFQQICQNAHAAKSAVIVERRSSSTRRCSSVVPRAASMRRLPVQSVSRGSSTAQAARRVVAKSRGKARTVVVHSVATACSLPIATALKDQCTSFSIICTGDSDPVNSILKTTTPEKVVLLLGPHLFETICVPSSEEVLHLAALQQLAISGSAEMSVIVPEDCASLVALKLAPSIQSLLHKNGFYVVQQDDENKMVAAIASHLEGSTNQLKYTSAPKKAKSFTRSRSSHY